LAVGNRSSRLYVYIVQDNIKWDILKAPALPYLLLVLPLLLTDTTLIGGLISYMFLNKYK
jgi:hypothetical protein